ncbi:SNF2 family N-terminal domain-containing protein [Russula earlei]|uniref:SNF2 family N-terminal domain-containing protein n=1 Tax=Russula earlei TaxID=71964 RepID=A0ACC0UP70_9AGAM|nr:SNF2 family N-terminal domain-containing protein [Russula earlei]
MEDIRRKLAQDPRIYPVPVGRNKGPSVTPSVITVTSSTSSSDMQSQHPTTYTISDSSDNERSQGTKNTENTHLRPTIAYPNPPAHFRGPAQPILVPSNADHPESYSRTVYHWESPNGPYELPYEPQKTAAEAEKDLQDLLQQSYDGKEDGENAHNNIDMSQAVVEGFREGIRLLPHQVAGRVWMSEREIGKKSGGILADDMGLGKTIQTLTRIVDGRPRKSDAEDGWAATTLVVCPVSLVSQWASEISKMAKTLTVIEHHGPSRTTNPETLRRAHVVITSYAIVASEHSTFQPKDESKPKKGSKSKVVSGSDSDSETDHFGRTLENRKKTAKTNRKKDALFRVKWWRIVLDEAHNIKNRNTKAAQACCALEGKFRWCLTGTPLQNSVEELYSLLKFLRIKPLNDWQTFNEQINKPVKSGRSVRAMKRLHVVLRAIMLRRRKTDVINGKPLIELPERYLSIVPCEFDEDERQFYFALENKIDEAMKKFAKNNEVMKNYTNVMVLLLRLRQACNHPSLVTKDYNTDREAIESRPAPKDDQEDEELNTMFQQLGVSKGKKCQLCQDELTPGNVSKEGERCRDCIELTRKVHPKSLSRDKDSNLPPKSAKIRKILELLKEISSRENDEGDPMGEKTIVFSQFTTMLDLIQPFLKDSGISFVRYDGSMTKEKREISLDQIKNNKQIRVILISFKAGSTGLNLTACNNVILVDMWWNPALEDQAFDRAHRLGQTRDVNIYKLTIENTVEERILALQNSKRALATAALSGDRIKNLKLGLEDLMMLFRPGRDDDDD